MDALRIDFRSEPWREMAPGARHKVVERSGKRIRLVEFTDVFVEHDWCAKGHVGFVLDGELELTLEDGAMRLGPGEAFVTRAGLDKHKARSVGPAAVIVLVEDV
jgi:quercetin dioxygenase-like cupin family protein